MRMKRAKKDVEILNKVNGFNYLITATNGETAFAARILERKPELKLNSEKIQITEENCICFSIVNDPNIPEVPTGYSVADGILVKNGVAVTEQGQLVIRDILHVFPGKLILSVEPKEPLDGYVDVFYYEPDNDCFKKIIRSHIPNPEVIEYEKGIILMYSRIYETVETDADGKNTRKEYFDKAGLVFVNSKGSAEAGMVLSCPISKLTKIVGKYLLFEIDKNVNKNGVVVNADAPYTLAINTSSMLKTELMINNITAATVCQINDSIAIKSEDSFLCTGEGADIAFTNQRAMKKINGYDYLIDINYSKNLTLMFSNENYEVKVLEIVQTRDRGQVITVKDF